MKILVVSNKIPYPITDGASLCIYNIFKRLSNNHDIYLITFSKKNKDGENLIHIKDIFKDIYLVEQQKSERIMLRYLINLASWRSGFLMKAQHKESYNRFREKIDEIVSFHDIEIVHCVTLFAAEYVYGLMGCLKVLHLIDSSTLEMRRRLSNHDKSGFFKKLHNLYWYYRIMNYERLMTQEFDASITVGKKDYDVLKSLSSDANIVLIPNGVDTEYFHPKQKKEHTNHHILIFSGNMSFPPNIDAVMYFYHDIFPLIRAKIPSVRFFIVGTSPGEKIRTLSRDVNVLVTGYVDDIRPYIWKADVVVCPMRTGGGIKNKILESMSSGRPVVTTSIGAEGIDVRHNENIKIADTPEEFSNCVLDLLSEQSLADKIAQNAHELIDRSYTWNICSRKYEELYENLLKGHLSFENS